MQREATEGLLDATRAGVKGATPALVARFLFQGIFKKCSRSINVALTDCDYSRAAGYKGASIMQVLSSDVESFTPGQRVRTSFGPGVISAISHIDSIIYVVLSDDSASLYLFHPEQVAALDEG
jgi:hypothetical protein